MSNPDYLQRFIRIERDLKLIIELLRPVQPHALAHQFDATSTLQDCSCGWKAEQREEMEAVANQWAKHFVEQA